MKFTYQTLCSKRLIGLGLRFGHLGKLIVSTFYKKSYYFSMLHDMDKVLIKKVAETKINAQEIDAVIGNLVYPFDLVVKLLYGCGLRLFECLNLRINNFNFDNRILTVHDGKGQKDRTVPLPESIIPELNEHLGNVKKIYKNDSDAKFDGAFLFYSLEKKYKNCAKEFIWQWFFPAVKLTIVPETNEKNDTIFTKVMY